MHAIAHAVCHKIDKPRLAYGLEGIGHQHQIDGDVAALLFHFREHAGTVGPPIVVHDLEPAPAAEIIAA